MPDDKDHLTDQLKQREQAAENQFFEEQSRRQIEKLRATHAQSASSGKATCPRCGAPLEIKQVKGIGVDACPKGDGIWLDKGELDQIEKRQGDSWLSRLLLGSPS